jgi:hypothetical protein
MGGGFTAPTNGGGGLFGTSTTGGSQLGGAPALHGGLFGNKGGGGFSNTSAPTSTGFTRNITRHDALFISDAALSIQAVAASLAAALLLVAVVRSRRQPLSTR